eukprot:362322-Chlamydomonas_euryale.AAC.16
MDSQAPENFRWDARGAGKIIAETSWLDLPFGARTWSVTAVYGVSWALSDGCQRLASRRACLSPPRRHRRAAVAAAWHLTATRPLHCVGAEAGVPCKEHVCEEASEGYAPRTWGGGTGRAAQTGAVAPGAF